MSYIDFLALLQANTGYRSELYKETCRFCLKYQPDGIDIGNNNINCRLKQRRDAILNNYISITQQYLPTSDEYPKFVCSACEKQLNDYAHFAQQIERNAENWETYLKNGCDVKVDSNEFINPTTMPVKEIEEIKIECCDEEGYIDNNVPPDGDIFHNDASIDDEPLPVKVETIVVKADEGNSEESAADEALNRKKRKRKINYEPRPLFVNLSTEYERTCKLCDEPTFVSLESFYKHQRQHHPDAKSFICGICNSRFNNKYRLASHMKDRHTKWGKKHQCQFCAKLFYSDREVKGHEKLHENARSYVCSLCGKGFNSKTTLNCHLRSKVHNTNYKRKSTAVKKPRPHTYTSVANNSKKTFRCLLCVPSTVYLTSEERTEHRNMTHRRFECNICKNSFMAQESLDSHKLLHSNKPRPFVCTVCNATFNQSSHLTSHFNRKHTDKRSFRCSHCDKSFFESCEVKAHVRLVHNKQERVKCTQCDCSFATEKYLQKHILQKHSTSATPYDCKICGKRNVNGARLDQHRLKCHNKSS